MKRFFLASLAVVCVGLALATAQTINRSVQLSFDSNGLIGFSTQNAMFLPGKLHGNNQRTPSIASFGTSAAITGTDLAGEVVMGTSSNVGGTITFAQAYASTPYCNASGSGNATPLGVFTSPNGININYAMQIAAMRFYYICIGARA